MRIILIFLACASLPLNTYAKEFTRDYTYRAGDDDSKNSARVKAIEQVKLILLEEIGVYVQSYLEIDKRSSSSSSTSFLSHEIRTTTAGITKTEVLTEEWNGKEYKLNVRIDIDIEDVVKRINATLEARKKNQNIEKLNSLIELKNSEISELNTTLNIKKTESKRQQNKLAVLENEIISYKLLLNEQIQYEREMQSNLARIKERIEHETNIANKLIIGMTESEIYKIAGNPSAKDRCTLTNDLLLNYGRNWIHIANGIYKGYIPIKDYSGACDIVLKL